MCIKTPKIKTQVSTYFIAFIFHGQIPLFCILCVKDQEGISRTLVL